MGRTHRPRSVFSIRVQHGGRRTGSLHSPQTADNKEKEHHPYDWLSTRYVTYSDIQYMDRGQVRVLKNSIYARHGRRFKDANLRAYFNSQSWYYPTRNEVPAREFNKYENYNINFLLKYE